MKIGILHIAARLCCTMGMITAGCLAPETAPDTGDESAGESAQPGDPGVVALGAVCAPTILFEEDFSDNSAGWALEAGWQIGSAKTSSCQGAGFSDPAADHTPTSDNGVAGVFIGGCPSIVNSSPNYYLTSPVVGANVAGSVSLSFWRWLNTSYRNRSRVEVFDGSSWVLLYESPTTVTSSDWTNITYDLTPYKNPNLRVRFGYRSTIALGGWVESNWNLDDVQITTDTCG